MHAVTGDDQPGKRLWKAQTLQLTTRGGVPGSVCNHQNTCSAGPRIQLCESVGQNKVPAPTLLLMTIMKQTLLQLFGFRLPRITAVRAGIWQVWLLSRRRHSCIPAQRPVLAAPLRQQPRQCATPPLLIETGRLVITLGCPRAIRPTSHIAPCDVPRPGRQCYAMAMPGLTCTGAH